jgi:hypothetical protein
MTVAQLGFIIDSSQATAATHELDKLDAAAKKVDKSAATLGASLKTSGVQAADLLNNTSLSVTARARLAEQLQKQGVATNAVTVASGKLLKGQAAAVQGMAQMASGVKQLGTEQDKTEGSSNRFINTLTRRFVFGFIVSQIRQAISSIAALNSELAKTGDVARITGTGGQLIQGLQAGAAAKGIGSAQFLDDMLKFNQQIPLAKAGIGELGQLFRGNGIAVRDTTDAFFKLADLVKNAKDDTARLSILQQAGLPATREMVNFMSQGAEAIKRQAREASKLTDQQLADAKRLEERWNTMWDNFTRWGKKSIVDIAGSMDQLGDAITQFYLRVNPDLAGPLKLTISKSGTSRPGGIGSDPDRNLSFSTTNKTTRDVGPERAKFQKQISEAQMRVGVFGETPSARDLVVENNSNRSKTEKIECRPSISFARGNLRPRLSSVTRRSINRMVLFSHSPARYSRFRIGRASLACAERLLLSRSLAAI